MSYASSFAEKLKRSGQQALSFRDLFALGLDERGEPFADLLRDGYGVEVALADADEDVFAACDGAGGVGLAADLEVQMDRGPADLGEVRLDDEELVQLDRRVEIAFHAHAGKPDVQRLEEVLVGQAGGAQQLRF